MPRTSLSMTMSLYQPADQPVHSPANSTSPSTRYRKHSYTSNVIGNSLSLPDKLELLDNVRNRRSSTGSLTPQMTPFGSPLGSPSGSPYASPSGSPRTGIRRKSFSPQAGTLIRKGSLSSLDFIEEEQLQESIDGFVKEAYDDEINKTPEAPLDRQVSVDIETCMTIEHAERQRTCSTPLMVAVPSAAAVAMEREEVTSTFTKENINTSMMESLIRANNTTDPFGDSLNRSNYKTNADVRQDSVTRRLEQEKSSLTAAKRLSKDIHPTATATATAEESALILKKGTTSSTQRLSLDSQLTAIAKDKPVRRVRMSLDSSPMFLRMSQPPMDPVYSSSSLVPTSSFTTKPTPSSSSSPTSPKGTVKVSEINTLDSYRTNSDKMKKNTNNNITAINNNNDNSAHKDTLHLSNPPQPRSSNPLLSLFRTNRPMVAWPAFSFPSWSTSVDGTTNALTSSSMWSRMRSPSSHPSLSARENENLRKLKEEMKRDKTTRLQSSVSSSCLPQSPSHATATAAPATASSSSSSSSLVGLSEMMNTGGEAPSMRLVPVDQRVYVP